jgi:uncharacterized membrane protein
MSGGAVFIADRDQSIPIIRRIRVTDLFHALGRGVEDFLAAPTQLLFLGLIYPMVGGVAAAFAAQVDVIPMLYPLIAGITLMGPLAALGLYELSRQREMGREVTWRNAFDVRRSPALGSVAWLGSMLLALFVGWLAVAEHIYGATMGGLSHPDGASFLQQLFGTSQGWAMIAIGNGVGLLFAVTVLCLSVVSFPFLLDRGGGVFRAIHVSVLAVRHNPGMMMLWGLMVAALLLLGCLPLFVGLAVVMPVLGHATWHLYRAMIV